MERAEANLSQARADLSFAELQLSHTEVRAPADGVISKKTVEPGQVVQMGQPLFAIEGDKAIQDVEAIGSGILRISPRAPESGAPVRVGVTLAFLVTADEADPFAGPEPGAYIWVPDIVLQIVPSGKDSGNE